jgi:hypothetical protein
VELLLEENGRKTERHDTMGLMSNISDGKSTYIGIVEDISTGGLRISKVPASFDDTVGRCYSVVTGPEDDFTIALQPRWTRVTNNGMYKIIGFQIENAPEDWTAFVNELDTSMDPFSALVTGQSLEM